ncbi:hypothetical protein THARTR1_01799 [Trichoderma harzianum]|uniref:Uncharacterized protein n=1 Tax=Trichoderma harzianum TaxID=5544 RepID=A0A2K0UKI0_TRIHA|nr:hypothetical protein THARTR1_01799 [Trichoderma harzianum]
MKILQADKVHDTAYTSRDLNNPWQGEGLIASRSKHCGELQQWTFRDVKALGPVKICFWSRGSKWMNRNGDPVGNFAGPSDQKSVANRRNSSHRISDRKPIRRAILRIRSRVAKQWLDL